MRPRYIEGWKVTARESNRKEESGKEAKKKQRESGTDKLDGKGENAS